MRFSDEQVQYQVGYFPSRTTVQYMVALAGQTDHQLRVSSASASDARSAPLTYELTNQLGASIGVVYLRMDDDTLFRAKEVADATTATLEQIDEVGLIRGLRDVFRNHILEPPPGFDRSLMRDGLLSRNYGSRGGVSNRDGILERALNRLANGHGIMDQPNSYVAVVDRSVHTPLGLQDVRESDSLYVVTGRFDLAVAGLVLDARRGKSALVGATRSDNSRR